MSSIIDVNLQVKKIKVARQRIARLTEKDLQDDSSKVISVINDISDAIDDINNRAPLDYTDFEDIAVDGSGSTIYNLRHGFNQSVRWWVTRFHSTGGGGGGSGVAVVNAAITGGGTTVTHGLGVVPTGYLTTRIYDGSNGIAPGDLSGGAFTSTQWDMDIAFVGTLNFDLWFYTGAPTGGSAGGLSEDASTDANTLALVSRSAGTATIRVMPRGA